MTDAFETRHLIVAAAWLGGGLFLGIAVYRLVLRPLVRRSTLTTTGADDVVLGAIREGSVLWLTVAGAFGARNALPLRPGVAHTVDRILLAVLILSVTVVIGRIVTDGLKYYTLRKAGVMPSSSILIGLARLIVYVIGGLVLLQTFGVSITPMLTALGVGGLAVGLALQDTLSNLFAGLQVVASRNVRVGDFVRLDDGLEGEVVDVNWRNTTIRQLPNNIVIVPNGKLAGTTVINFNMPEQEMSVLMQVGVSYDSDLEHVEAVTIDVARKVLKETAGATSDFDPFIRYHTFNDFSIDFTVILRVKTFVDQYLVKHEFVKTLHQRYNEEGITIPFPIRTVEFSGDGAPEKNASASGQRSSGRRRP